MKAYSTREVADLLGIPAQRVRWLVRSGVVAPRLGTAAASNSRSRSRVAAHGEGLADANLKPRKILTHCARSRSSFAGRSAAECRARADRRRSCNRPRQQHELGARVEADVARLQRARARREGRAARARVGAASTAFGGQPRRAVRGRARERRDRCERRGRARVPPRARERLGPRRGTDQPRTAAPPGTCARRRGAPLS